MAKPVTLVIGGDSKICADGSIYLDDGETFDFEEGIFLYRNFTFENGILKCFKGNTSEKEVPWAFRESHVTAIKIYWVDSSGEVHKKEITNLNLSLSGEWTYRAWDLPLDGTVVGSGRSIYAIVCLSILFAVAGVTVAAILLRKKKSSEERAMMNTLNSESSYMNGQ
jgi:hypothetical protein